MEYGLGYVWNPDELNITVGDSVRWNWYGTSFTRQLSVQQVDSPEDTDYNGDGFISDSSTRGSFNHVFTEAGDYYYIAGDYGDIGQFGEYTMSKQIEQQTIKHFKIHYGVDSKYTYFKNFTI